MKKVLFIFGTRPEAIKMCPLVNELKKRKEIKTIVCVTGQHKEILQSVLDTFSVVPDFSLDVMKKEQTLFDITTEILSDIKNILIMQKPDLILVHGDTTSAFCASLSAFYLRIPVGHVEAGLRTHNIFSPYPEEFNRQAISLIASYHFAPTELARQNLLSEGKDEDSIFVTGNTVIDAMKSTIREDFASKNLADINDRKLILLTAHRRENLGNNMRSIFSAVRRLCEEHDDIFVLYPCHPNPKIKAIAFELLGKVKNLKITAPLDTAEFHNILARSYLVLTDSGGVQEEASALCVPTLVLRDHTERTEGVKTGVLRLIGTDENDIYENTKLLLERGDAYLTMKNSKNPFGDGKASIKIADIIEKILQ